MMNEEQQLIDRYLHGELDDAEQESLEERFFVDDDLFEQIEVAEMRLIDIYFRGEMDGAARERFESGYLTTPERSAKVGEAQVFHREIARMKPSKKEGWLARFLEGISFSLTVPQMATVATILLLAVGAFWVFRMLQSDLPDVVEANTEVNTLEHSESPETDVAIQTNRSEAQQIGPSVSENRTPQPAPVAGGRSVFATLLLPTRSGGDSVGNSVTLLQDTRELNLRIVVPGTVPFDNYRIAVFGSDGSSIWSVSGVSSTRTGRSLVVTAAVPAEIFKESTYKVQVEKVNDTEGMIWSYPLRVIR